MATQIRCLWIVLSDLALYGIVWPRGLLEDHAVLGEYQPDPVYPVVDHDEHDHHQDDVPEDVLRDRQVGGPARGARALPEGPPDEEAGVADVPEDVQRGPRGP